MSIHINRFVDSVKAHESRGQKDFSMSLRDAKDLHSDITKMLLAVTELQRRLLDTNNSQIVNVELSGKDF
jgi:Mg2+ and Co2+ transporter CorA